MHCEIIDHQLSVFFVQIQLKKENLKSVFQMPEFRYPSWYTGLQNGLDTLLEVCSKLTMKTPERRH